MYKLRKNLKGQRASLLRFCNHLSTNRKRKDDEKTEDQTNTFLVVLLESDGSVFTDNYLQGAIWKNQPEFHFKTFRKY